ncbi:MAG TPA: hypothetical protein VNS81_09130 [Nocardioides sp.]|nr:hypothetical protein [Nocardioides sp.]
MATHAAAPQGDGLDGLLDASPDLGVHTSAAAELGLLLGLAAVLAAPFTIMYGLAAGFGAVGAASSFVGVVATSRANVAGRALAPWGLLFAVVALALVGLRYLGVDTAFGDDLLPTIGDGLEGINDLLPRP